MAIEWWDDPESEQTKAWLRRCGCDGVHRFSTTPNHQPKSPTPEPGEPTALFAWHWARFVVTSGHGNEFRGGWRSEDDARRFAYSVDSKATVREVAPYRWAPAWGNLPD